MAVGENVSKILAIKMICASNLVGSNLNGIVPFSRGVHDRVREVSPLLSGEQVPGHGS